MKFNVLNYIKRLLHTTACTRIRDSDTPLVLDLVISISNDSFIDEVKHLAPLVNSDHSIICVKCCLPCNYRPVYNKLNYNKGDYVSLKQSLDIDWDSTFESSDIDAMWNVLKDRIIIKTHQYISPIKVFNCPINRKRR